MNIRDLEYLLAIYELGHFGKATETYFVSQNQASKLTDIIQITKICNCNSLLKDLKFWLNIEHPDLICRKSPMFLKNNNLSYEEMFPLIKLAIPLIMSGFVSASVGFFSTIFLARLGHQELAAGAIVIWLFATLMCIVWGTLSSVSILVAQKHGAKGHKAVALILREGILLALLFVIPAALLLWNIKPILLLMGQSQTTVVLSMRYIHGLVWGLPADFLELVLMQFIIGLGHSRTNLAFTLIFVPLNIISSYLLTFGKMGLPALGIAGIGWGTTISFWIIFLIIVFYLACHSKYKHYLSEIFSLQRLHFIRELVHIGIPMGAMFTVEVAYFLTLTLLMGHLGSQELAANQIALQYLGQLSVITFSIAQAVTVRMGHTLGANEIKSAKHACYWGIGIAAACMSLVAIIYWIFPLKLIALDFNIYDPKNAPIIHYAKEFLKISALFQLIEAIRLTLFGALRSLKDTRFTLYTSILSFWGIALPIGYLLAVPLHLEGSGLWWGLVIGATGSAALLFWRFFSQINRLE